jgi:hypothetical protein
MRQTEWKSTLSWFKSLAVKLFLLREIQMSKVFVRKPIINCIGQTQEQIDNANHVITIVWGTCQDKTETYAFDTEEDKEMFLLGVDAACGYLEYEIEGE